jgi:hypothetical protein
MAKRIDVPFFIKEKFGSEALDALAFPKQLEMLLQDHESSFKGWDEIYDMFTLIEDILDDPALNFTTNQLNRLKTAQRGLLLDTLKKGYQPILDQSIPVLTESNGQIEVLSYKVAESRNGRLVLTPQAHTQMPAIYVHFQSSRAPERIGHQDIRDLLLKADGVDLIANSFLPDEFYDLSFLKLLRNADLAGFGENSEADLRRFYEALMVLAEGPHITYYAYEEEEIRPECLLPGTCQLLKKDSFFEITHSEEISIEAFIALFQKGGLYYHEESTIPVEREISYQLPFTQLPLRVTVSMEDKAGKKHRFQEQLWSQELFKNLSVQERKLRTARDQFRARKRLRKEHEERQRRLIDAIHYGLDLEEVMTRLIEYQSKSAFSV